MVRINSDSVWQYVYFDIPNESWTAFTGDGDLDGDWGTLEALCITAVSGDPTTNFTLYVDDIYQGPEQSPLYTLEFTSAGSQDGYIRESSETSNVGGSNSSTNIRNYIGDRYDKIQYKAVLSFDTSSLPDNANITAATLKHKRGAISHDPSDLGDMKADIKKPSFGTTSIENSDFQASADASQVATMSYPSGDGDWSSGSINSTGRSYINKTGVTQFRIYFETDDNNDGYTDYFGFYSGDYEVTADHPKLEVKYQLP